MLSASEIGLRSGVAAAGVGSVVLAGHADDPVTRLLAVLSAVVFLGPLVVLLVADVREWRGHRAPEPDPTGRPRAAEWVLVVVFHGVLFGFGYAGVLDLRRGGSGELLATALVVGVVVLLLTIEFLGRWWRHRRARG